MSKATMTAEQMINDRDPLVFLVAIDVATGEAETKLCSVENWRLERLNLKEKYKDRLIFTRHNRAAIFEESKYFVSN